MCLALECYCCTTCKVQVISIALRFYSNLWHSVTPKQFNYKHSEYLVLWKWNLNAFSSSSWSCFTFQLVLLFLWYLLLQYPTSLLSAVHFCHSVILGSFDQKPFYLCLAALLWSVWEKWRHAHTWGLRWTCLVVYHVLVPCYYTGKGFSFS